MEQMIVYCAKKNLAAMVAKPYELQKLVADSVVIPFSMLRGVECCSFDCVFQGLEALQWAKFWLTKRDNRARSAGCYVPTPSLVRESKITARACKKEFLKAGRKPKIAKIKMIVATR